MQRDRQLDRGVGVVIVICACVSSSLSLGRSVGVPVLVRSSACSPPFVCTHRVFSVNDIDRCLGPTGVLSNGRRTPTKDAVLLQLQGRTTKGRGTEEEEEEGGEGS